MMLLLISKKINSKLMTAWVRNMSYNNYKELRAGVISTSGSAEIRPQSLADTLRQLPSAVLQVPKESVKLESSFLTLGEDSFAAIEVASRANKRYLHLIVPRMFTTKTLAHLSTFTEHAEQ